MACFLFLALNMIGIFILQLMLVKLKKTEEFTAAYGCFHHVYNERSLLSMFPAQDTLQERIPKLALLPTKLLTCSVWGKDDYNCSSLISTYHAPTTVQIRFRIPKATLQSRSCSHSSWQGNWGPITLNKVSKVTHLACFRPLILPQSHLTLKPVSFPPGWLL